MNVQYQKNGGLIFTKNLILLGKLPFRFAKWQFSPLHFLLTLIADLGQIHPRLLYRIAALVKPEPPLPHTDQ